jgi:hypothetical protein
MRNKPTTMAATRLGRTTIRVRRTRMVGCRSIPQSIRSGGWLLQALVGHSILFLLFVNRALVLRLARCLAGAKLAILQQNGKGVPLTFEALYRRPILSRAA